MAYTIQEVSKEPELAITLVHRPYLDASVVEVVVGELEHALRPLGRAILARALLLAPRHCLKVSCVTRRHSTQHAQPPTGVPRALLSQTLAAVVVDLQAG